MIKSTSSNHSFFCTTNVRYIHKFSSLNPKNKIFSNKFSTSIRTNNAKYKKKIFEWPPSKITTLDPNLQYTTSNVDSKSLQREYRQRIEKQHETKILFKKDRFSIYKEFHKTMNGTIVPYLLSIYSKIKIVQQCSINSHKQPWVASLCERILARHKYGCPECYRIRRQQYLLCSAAPEIYDEIHPTKNSSLDNRQLTIYSHKFIWWACSKGHEQQQKINSRFLLLRINKLRKDMKLISCMHCQKEEKLKTNSLAICSPNLAKLQDYDRNKSKLNLLGPESVFRMSNKLVQWVCDKNKNHRYTQRICHKVYYQCGCKICYKSKKLNSDKNNISI